MPEQFYRKSFIYVACCMLASLMAMALPAHAQTPGDSAQKPETRYFDQLREIPVMPELRATKDGASAFDKPEGRIVHVRATGREVSTDAIRTFYAKTLPALGWQPRSADTYVRDAEKLTLGFDREGRKVILELSLRPRQQE